MNSVPTRLRVGQGFLCHLECNVRNLVTLPVHVYTGIYPCEITLDLYNSRGFFFFHRGSMSFSN